MMLILVLSIVVGIVIYFNRKEQQKQESRDAYFRRVMHELDEKAKREGTFKRGYFDK